MTRELPVAGRWRLARVERALVLLLAADAVLAWVVVVGAYTFVERLWRELAGRPLGAGALETHLAQLEAAGVVHGAVWLATAIGFLAWVHEASRVLPVGVDGRSPRWSVGAFLLPGLNLVAGPRVVAELGRASARAGGRAPSAALLGAWWATFLLSFLADPGPVRLAGALRTRLAVGGPTALLVVGHLAEIAAALLAIRLVRTIGAGARAAPIGPP